MLEIGNAGMSEVEEQTHFSFWAALKSPLIIGANLAVISNSSLNILLNKEIIAVNQDDAGVAVDYIPELSTEGSIQIWAGPLQSGSSKFLVLAMNEKNVSQDIIVPLAQVPRYAEFVHRKPHIRDVWAKESLQQSNGTVILERVDVHETKVLIFSSD